MVFSPSSILCVVASNFIFLAFGACATEGESPFVVAKVGRAEISFLDISRKIGVENAYGNAILAPETALAALLNDALEREAASSVGVEATAAEIADFSKHADETSRAVDILKKVKSVFGEDKGGYERIYLAPKINSEKLRAFYSRDPLIHKDERVNIEKAFAFAVGGKSMQEAAAASGLICSLFDVRETDLVQPPELQKLPLSEKRSRNAMLTILDNLSIGEIEKSIVEDDNSYKVIKLSAKEGGKYSIEAIVVAKRPYEAWFEEQAAKIPIEIYNADLKKNVIKHYPSLWWVKRLRP